MSEAKKRYIIEHMMDRITVVITGKNQDGTIYRGKDKTGANYQFKKSQIVGRVEDDKEKI